VKGKENPDSGEPFRVPPPLSPVPELRCILAAQAGDPLAMSEMIDALAPFVGRLCASIALDAGPDAAQEALIQVMRDLRRLRDPTALMPWVRRIASREAVRHAQRERRHPGVPDAAEALPAPGDPTLAHDVKHVLRSLAPEQRAILVLRDLEGLSEDEAARLLDVARGTAKSRLHRARSAFRDLWRSE
jgi:RNA polymerase sigma factor (sigma-70 family)